jgi:hypothetical protein
VFIDDDGQAYLYWEHQPSATSFSCAGLAGDLGNNRLIGCFERTRRRNELGAGG